VSGESTAARIDALLAEIEGADRAFAIGWLTVDLDRAAAELAGALGMTPHGFIQAAESRLLGARCRVALGALSGRRSAVILEPATEGRLAGALARRDEGPWVVWLVASAEREQATSDPHAGPFGPERLILDGLRWGPFQLLAQREAGTIRS